MRDRVMSLIRGPGLLVFGLWLLFVASSPGRNGTIDAMMRQTVARQLWTAGTVAVNTIPPEVQGFPWIPAGPGRWVSPYGVGQVLLFVPFDMVGAALERVSPPAWREQVRWLPIAFILLPLLGVGLWLALRALLREWGLPDPWPVVGASVMMLATLLFHYVGDPQEEVLVALCVTLAVLFVLRLRRQPSWRFAALVGMCAGGALMTRSVSIFALAIVPVLSAAVVAPTTASRRMRSRGSRTAMVAVGLKRALAQND